MIRIHLSDLLGKKRWTQKYLSDITGIRPNTINQFYHEFVDRISIEHLDKICEAFDCQISDLLEYVPDKKTEKK